MNAEPSAKTGYTVLAGAAVSILVWVVTTVAHIDIPAEIAAAATTLITGAIAILVPAKSGKYVEIEPKLDSADLIENRADIDPDVFEDATQEVV